MALTKIQADAVTSLFSDLFAKNDNEKERKKLFLDFEDVFGKGIHDWQSVCREKLEGNAPDKEIIEQFDALANRKEKEDNKEYLVRELVEADLEVVRELINRAFDMCLTVYDDKKFDKFIKSGFSFVACNDEEILGVVLGYAIPDLSMDAVYIDTFAVAETVRGCGIGRALLSHVSKCAKANDIFVIKLHTYKTKEAYQIYKHLGFQENELVQLKRYIY